MAALAHPGAAKATPPLRVPWPCAATYRITQAHHTGTHTGKGAWAWDMNLGVGEPVVAPADGTVRLVRQDSTRHGCDRRLAWDANYVVLDFGDGTEALFLHLRQGSVPVRPGQKVRAGELIGEVGNSGYTCGTHLHFQIQQSCDSWWCQSIPAQFEGFGSPEYAQQITSNNCPKAPSDEDFTPVMADQMEGGQQDKVGGGTRDERGTGQP